MDVKRLTRGPTIWVIVFVVLLIIGARVFAPNQFKKVDTSEAINLIKSDNVVSAKIVDRDQRLELTLKDSAKIDGYAKVTPAKAA
jgi:cell division protease FtsH